MQTEIRGVKISYKTVEELKVNVKKALDKVNEQLALVEKGRRRLMKQQRSLQKFLGSASASESTAVLALDAEG